MPASKEYSMTLSDLSTLDHLVEAFVQHQRRTRGLRDQTLQGYARIARLLIRNTLGEDPIDVGTLRPPDIDGFVRAMTGRYSPRSMKTIRSALRSLFRFLRTQGLCNERLEVAIPAAPSWRCTTLPRGLSDDQLQAVLASFDDSTPCGRRDRAMVLCLSTLGLRPGEVAALELEDFDWRRGIVYLRTRKTRRGATLPLPRDAGRAIVDYLRQERPKSSERRVFLQHRGCRKGAPISSGVVSAAVYRALKRTGIEAPITGAYVFRHTVASRMVRKGTRLKEVADFLGHHCLDTTAIYAKVDVPALCEVALPWPEVTS
jgi:site-specific recombinase XerD